MFGSLVVCFVFLRFPSFFLVGALGLQKTVGGQYFVLLVITVKFNL